MWPFQKLFFKMHSIGYYFGISKQTEVLILTLLGICTTIFDASLLDLNSNLHKVWAAILDPEKVPGSSQIFLKYILSGIILVRSFSVHLYLAFYIVMLWPAIFEERPALLLPWLTVGAIKCLAMGAISFSSGMYTCFKYGGYRPACFDFLVAQIIDHIPSFYIWFSVLSYYRELKLYAPSALLFEKEKNKVQMEELAMRRRRVRSLTDDFKLKDSMDEARHLSASTIDNLLQEMSLDMNRKNTRSLDSLLSLIDNDGEKSMWMHLYEDSSTDEDELSVSEKTQKFLKVTESEIKRAREQQRQRTEPLLSDSMLDMEHFDAEKPIRPRADLSQGSEKRTSFAKDLKLRPTKSEKSDINSSKDYQKIKTAPDFLQEVSEFELGCVSNDSLSNIELKEEMSEPKSVGKSYHISLKSSDFTCQASTLSRNALNTLPTSLEQSQLKEVIAEDGHKNNSKRTALTNPTGKTNAKPDIAQSKMEELSRKQRPSFKLDGYTLAYIEKTRKLAEQKQKMMSNKK